MKTHVALLAICGMLACAGPAAAQSGAASTTGAGEPAISFRPFALGTFQWFSAQETFKATFGAARQPFYGGGLDVAFRSGLFVDLTASRFNKTGQRAFRFNGQNFDLGIPLTVTEIPFEVSAGYRFPGWHNIRPYVGAGAGSYGYKESSDFSAAGENVDTRHAGYLVVGGAEVRVVPWVSVSADAQWTRVTGILGTGGISKDANENDLGGVAARIRLIVGK